MELLIAVSLSLAVVGAAMGVYSQMVRDDTRLAEARRENLDRTRVLNLVGRLLEFRSGSISGTRFRLCLASDLNILGYGREVVLLEQTGTEQYPSLHIRIVPFFLSGMQQEEDVVSLLYRDTLREFPYSFDETLDGFGVSFFYGYEEPRPYEVEQENPGYIRALITDRDGNEWIIARNL